MAESLPFAEILKLLFLHRTREDGTPYKAADVARATAVSPAQISLLLSGQRSNTSIETARSLIRFFDVSFDILNASTMEEATKLIDDRQAKDKSSLRLRGKLAQELSPHALHQIEQLIQYVLEREKAEAQGQPLPPLPFSRDE